jgi:hypothetical protein
MVGKAAKIAMAETFSHVVRYRKDSGNREIAWIFKLVVEKQLAELTGLMKLL